MLDTLHRHNSAVSLRKVFVLYRSIHSSDVGRTSYRQIQKELRRIRKFQKVHTLKEEERTELEIESRAIPEGPELDRFLRYEASLNREYERIVNAGTVRSVHSSVRGACSGGTYWEHRLHGASDSR